MIFTVIAKSVDIIHQAITLRPKIMIYHKTKTAQKNVLIVVTPWVTAMYVKVVVIKEKNELEKILEEHSDTEKQSDISASLDRIKNDERSSKIRLIFVGCITAAIIIFVVIAATITSNAPTKDENLQSNAANSTSTNNPTPTQKPKIYYQGSSTTSSYSSAYDGKITKSTKLPDGYPGFIEIVSYCEVDMPDLIGYDASISLDESYTNVVKTDLRYKLDTSRLKLKADGSYHSAVLILEFTDNTYKNYHYAAVEIDGVKLK